VLKSTNEHALSRQAGVSAPKAFGVPPKKNPAFLCATLGQNHAKARGFVPAKGKERETKLLPSQMGADEQFLFRF
jgi:hypothetical protein